MNINQYNNKTNYKKQKLTLSKKLFYLIHSNNMRDNIQAKTLKQFFNLKSIKYKRIANPAGSLIAFNSQKQKVANIIEFPLIQKNGQKQPPHPTVLILQKKIAEQQLVRINKQKQIKSLSKYIEENRKKKVDQSMNMLGLDVIRIKCLNIEGSNQTKRQTNFKRISKISQKMSQLRLQKDFSQQLSSTHRKITQNNQHYNQINKLQVTDSFVLMNKRKNRNNSAYRARRMSINTGQQTPDACVVNTISPTKSNNPRKKQYLYKKLQGTQFKKKQQFGQVYQRRIRSYQDLLFKTMISHNYYLSLDLKFQDVNNRPKKLKAYVGPGNNGAMIKGLIKRRFWWTIVDQRTEDCHFVWTQIKINQIFNKQLKTISKKITSSQKQPASYSIQCVTGKSPNKKKKIGQSKQSKFFQNNQAFNYKLLHQKDQLLYKKAYQKFSQRQRELTYDQKSSYIQKNLNLKQSQMPQLIHNHLQNNFYLGNKKALFHNLKKYYQLIKQNPFDYIPFTFHIKNGFKDPEYIKFCQYHKKRNRLIKKQEKQQEEGYQTKKKTRNIWIVKPGQNSNRGRGITVIDQVYQLNNIMKQNNKNSNKSKQKPKTSSTNDSSPSSKNQSESHLQESQQTQKGTFIVQMYIDRPFLYNNRKFDIRHYMLITNFFGVTRAYWYEEGYIRTSSYEFNVYCFQPEIHLTNDAVQKNFPDYHRYQPFNKLSYEQFQRYLDLNYSVKKYNFKEQILPQMKKMGTDAARSVFTKICPQNPMNNFQIFGLDFMIDSNFRPWLIQINTNPCLECQCPLLDRIIPYMVQQSFKLSIDIAYPPPCHYPSTYRHFAPLINLQNFKYQLIFDSQVQGQELINLYKKTKGNLIQQIGQIEEDQTFKDQGKQIKLDDFT